MCELWGRFLRSAEGATLIQQLMEAMEGARQSFEVLFDECAALLSTIRARKMENEQKKKSSDRSLLTEPPFEGVEKAHAETLTDIFMRGMSVLQVFSAGVRMRSWLLARALLATLCGHTLLGRRQRWAVQCRDRKAERPRVPSGREESRRDGARETVARRGVQRG